MATKRENLATIGLLVLRAGIGCLMLVHGIGKIQKFDEMSESFADPIGVGPALSLILVIGAEAGCSLLLIAGLGTRLAVIPLAFTMGMALFVIHDDDPWQVRELAAVYLLVYTALLAMGPGRLSMDHWLWSRRTKGKAGGGKSTAA